MRLTLKTLQSEMQRSFAAQSLKMDEMNTNLNERVDRVLFRLEAHIKETDLRFRENGFAFEGVSRRFEQIDKRFEQIDKRFEQVDKRFEEVDRRFEQIDRRFEEVDRRFEQVDKRFDKVDRQFGILRDEIIEGLSPYFHNLEKMLMNHEERITALEKGRNQA